MDVDENMDEKILFGACLDISQELAKNEETPHLGSTCTAQFNEQQTSILSEEQSAAKPNTRTVSIDGDPFEIEFGAQTYQETKRQSPHLNDEHFR